MANTNTKSANNAEANNTEELTVKKKCCNKVKNFFTKEAKEGQRVLNWKFGVLVIVVLALVWLI